jgi:hypothetical protein
VFGRVGGGVNDRLVLRRNCGAANASPGPTRATAAAARLAARNNVLMRIAMTAVAAIALAM